MPAVAPNFRHAPSVVSDFNETKCFVSIEGTVGFTAKARATDETLNTVEDTLVIPATGIAVIALDVSTLLDGEDVTFDGAQEDGGDPGFTFDTETQVSPKDSRALAVAGTVALNQDIGADTLDLVISATPSATAFTGTLKDSAGATIQSWASQALTAGAYSELAIDVSSSAIGRATLNIVFEESGLRDSLSVVRNNGVRSIEAQTTQVQPTGSPAHDSFNALGIDVSELANGTLDALVSQVSGISGLESSQASTTAEKVSGSGAPAAPVISAVYNSGPVTMDIAGTGEADKDIVLVIKDQDGGIVNVPGQTVDGGGDISILGIDVSTLSNSYLIVDMRLNSPVFGDGPFTIERTAKDCAFASVTQVQPPGDPSYDSYNALGIDASSLVPGSVAVRADQTSASSGLVSEPASNSSTKIGAVVEVTAQGTADGLGDYTVSPIDVSSLNPGTLDVEVCTYDSFLIKSCANGVTQKVAPAKGGAARTRPSASAMILMMNRNR